MHVFRGKLHLSDCLGVRKGPGGQRGTNIGAIIGGVIGGIVGGLGIIVLAFIIYKVIQRQRYFVCYSFSSRKKKQ